MIHLAQDISTIYLYAKEAFNINQGYENQHYSIMVMIKTICVK